MTFLPSETRYLLNAHGLRSDTLLSLHWSTSERLQATQVVPGNPLDLRESLRVKKITNEAQTKERQTDPKPSGTNAGVQGVPGCT